MPFDYDALGPAGTVLKTNAVRLDRAFAAGARPPERVSVPEWAARHRRFSEDAPIPGKWRHENGPYLYEIMDALSLHDPCEEVSIIKCAQSGGTAAVENWAAYVSDVAPGPMIWVQATLRSAHLWAAEKWWPMVEASPRLDPSKGGSIRAQAQADGDGSNKERIKFSRSASYIALAGANSAPSLRSRTMRYAVEDDLDQFPDDLDNQGSPEGMIDQRLKVFKSRGLSKRAKISTPTIKGGSKIERAVSQSDLREFYFKCPHCEDRFRIVWEPEATGERDIQWPEGNPSEAYLVPRCCGTVTPHWHKKSMVQTDGWLSVVIEGVKTPLVLTEEQFQALRTKMPASRKRAFNIHGMLTFFQTWADMAEGWVDAQGDQNKLKAWTMLMLGAPFPIKSDMPDHEELARLKDQAWGYEQMPYGPIAITQASDVQGDGIYTERVGWGPNGESWQLGARFIPGPTDVKGEGAWVKLDEYSRQPVTFPGGLSWPVDREMVDAGYHTEAAQYYCGKRPNRRAIFGRSGWTLPPIGRGENLVYERSGSRTSYASKKSKDKAWLVGVDGLKLTWSGFLRSTLRHAKGETEGQRPRGLCHFSRDTPPDWFEQVTSEAIERVQIGKKGSNVTYGFRQRWVLQNGRQNHYLDCRIYNIAAYHDLGLDLYDEAEWAFHHAKRYAPAAQPDLLAHAQQLRPVAASSPEPFIEQKEGYLDG